MAKPLQRLMKLDIYILPQSERAILAEKYASVHKIHVHGAGSNKSWMTGIGTVIEM